ncbi:hypothetical protein Syun_016990 [Stephania yunnanensis]|uniref:Uncharacterized protein n=1 Tax=Stephania yunnanensis TaxID=152371 RepID=A0AAP0J8C4_9MAGN
MLIVYLFSNIGKMLLELSLNVLEKLYAQASMTRALQLKQQLNNLKKGSQFHNL